MDMSVASHPYMVLGGVVTVLMLWNYVPKRSGVNNFPLPPGPKGFPVIGNLFDMPRAVEKPWLVYDDWFRLYGDMFYFKVLGQGYLLLGSATRTNDLFEKRSTNYSDRPELPMLRGLMGWGFNFALMPYGSWWRRHRRAFHQHFHADAVVKYQSIQLKEAHIFLRRLLVTPENFMHHIRHTFAATIMNITYGIKVSDTNDPYISNAEESLNGLGQALTPGKFLVDLLPILKYVPSWIPGAGFQRKAAYWRRVNVDMSDKPFDYVKETLRLGTAVPSLTAILLEALPEENNQRRAEEETVIKNAAAMAYVGGADTTVSAVQFFSMAMAMYPDVQQKAQAEIDGVIGPNRLPDFDDRKSLPYINAIVKESMRWQIVAPLALPHMCTNDDEYNGYFIPKGTICFGNAWTILHDPQVYPSPEEYRPERWLKDGQLNPEVPSPNIAAFGYGRRICPGRYLSDDSLYAMVSLILSVYNITPPVDDQGNYVRLDPKPTSGMISYPTHFECTIKPRSSTAEALICEQYTE